MLSVVGFICNVVHPLFSEWHRLLVSPLSLLLLDNLQSNLRRWQSVSTDNLSLLTVADSSDDSTPSNADQGDYHRHLLSVSAELSRGSHVIGGEGGTGGGSQTGESALRRASMPPLLSTTSVAGSTVRRGSSPVVGGTATQQHVSCRRVCLLSSLAEDTPPATALPSPPDFPCSDTSNQLDFSSSLLPNSVCCKNSVHHKDVILTDSICRADAESARRSCWDGGTFQLTSGSGVDPTTPAVICATADGGSVLNGAVLNGVYKGVRRGSAPVACPARLTPPAVSMCMARRGSAPSPGAAELIAAVSLWTKRRGPAPAFGSETTCTPCRRASVVLVESGPHFDQLSLLCLLAANNSSATLKLPPLEHSHGGGGPRERRSHSAHATVVLNPTAELVERRRSSSPVTFGGGPAVGTSAATWLFTSVYQL